jgi:hypothetical protein
MTKSARRADPEVRAFLERLPRHLTYSERSRACIRRFGARRAWSAEEIRAWRIEQHPVGRRSPIDADPEIRGFLLDRLGLIDVPDIHESGLRRFGERMPSRSAIYRFWQRVRGVRPRRRPEPPSS